MDLFIVLHTTASVETLLIPHTNAWERIVVCSMGWHWREGKNSAIKLCWKYYSFACSANLQRKMNSTEAWYHFVNFKKKVVGVPNVCDTSFSAKFEWKSRIDSHWFICLTYQSTACIFTIRIFISKESLCFLSLRNYCFQYLYRKCRYRYTHCVCVSVCTNENINSPNKKKTPSVVRFAKKANEWKTISW